jgi:hypothetical protein
MINNTQSMMPEGKLYPASRIMYRASSLLYHVSAFLLDNLFHRLHDVARQQAEVLHESLMIARSPE